MKDNIMFLWSGVVNKDSLIYNCILSLRENIKECNIFVVTPDLDKDSIRLLEEFKVKVFKFPLKDFTNRRMVCKIEKICELLENNIPEDGNLLVCDGDVVFCKNPFNVFHNNFDFLYTTRHIKDWIATNGGVIGFKNNQKSRNFINFFIEQIHNPTWTPYVNFRLNHPHNRNIKNIDWWVDQDFTHCINSNKESVNNGGLGFDIVVFDAGSEYNYITSGLNREQIQELIKSKNKYIVHLKGGGIVRW